MNTIGFSVNNKGYLFAGYIGGSSCVTDMWEYEPITDSWTQKANCPGPGRNGPTAFIVNNQAYVGMGSDVNAVGSFSDLYRFDPVANTYTAIANSPVARAVPAHFVIGGLAYIGCGYINSSTMLNDFTTYNPATNTWASISNFGGSARGWVYSDTVNGMPYVGEGADLNHSIFHNDNWTWGGCQLNVNIGRDTIICAGTSITLTDTNSNATHVWNTGATTASIIVNSSGTYWVHVIKGSCSGIDSIQLTVQNAPSSFSLGQDTTFCGAFNRVLSTGIGSTLWSTGGTASSINISTPGLYWAEVGNRCGKYRDSIVITQNAAPNINLGRDTVLCGKASIVLKAAVANASYLWQDGTVLDSLVTSVSGIYWVDVTVNGCKKRDSIAVNYITPTQKLDLGNDTTYCGPFSRRLTSVAHTIWNTGDTATYIQVTTPGMYWAKILACGDTMRDSILISQVPVPVVNLGNDTTLCAGKKMVIDAGSPGSTYQWQNSTNAQTYEVSATGKYSVTVSANGCSASDSIFVQYLASPLSFSLGKDTTICEDSSIVLSARQDNVTYIWSTGQSIAFIKINQPGQYSVIDSNTCGKTSASIQIDMRKCQCGMVFPTAFSPNNDGRNDYFYPLTQCPVQYYKMNIFNRWGQKIFTAEHIQDKWDGTYDGILQPIETYIFEVRYTDPYSGSERQFSGNVTLL